MPSTDKTSELFQEGLALHHAMIASDAARDRTAFARLSDLYYARLILDLKAEQPNVHDEVIFADAVVDALFSYRRNPAQYKPELSNALPLYNYLLMAARGDFKNLLARNRKYAREQSLNHSVDNYDGAPEYEREVATAEDVEQQIIDAASPVMDMIDRVLTDPLDQVLVRLILDGVRETPAFADVLEISHLSAEEQARQVKKHKDRIKKRLQRSDIRRELLQNE